MIKKQILITGIAMGIIISPITMPGKTVSAAVTTSTKDKTASVSTKKLGMSIANNYLNIRSKASTNSKIVGKLYKGSVAEIQKFQGDWVKVKSGSVSGYVAKEYLATGADAQNLFIKYGNPVAVVNTSTLRVRQKNSTNSKILGLIEKGQKYKLISQGKKWTKISYNGKKGYVANEYVTVEYKFEYAVSLKEEEANIKEELKASNQTTQSTPVKKPESSGTKTKTGEEIARYAKKFLGNPYKWGGTSLTKGADCSGFTQSVYKKFSISIPRTSKQQAKSGKKVKTSNIQKGDVVAYASDGVVNHVAIYIGNGKVIHASNPKDGIKISNYNYRSIHTIRRFI